MTEPKFWAPPLVEGENYKQIGKREYMLLEPYVITWEKNGTYFRVIVPPYMNTDFGTTPFGMWNGPDEKKGYVPHDFLYYQNKNAHRIPDQYKDWYQVAVGDQWKPAVADWKRAEADKFMYKVHIASGVPFLKAQTIYRAVRLFGKSYWDS
jgi:Protein of unknown function (DUF1353)